MDDATQQNASLVEQAAAASESMRNQADMLARAVSVFKVSKTATGSQGSPATQSALPAHKQDASTTTTPRAMRRGARVRMSPSVPSTVNSTPGEARQVERITSAGRSGDEWEES